jgi:hypothetical protein
MPSQPVTLVRQSNLLVEGRYRLDLTEKRLLLFMMGLIQPTDREFQTYDVDLEALTAVFPTSHKDVYRQFEKVTDRLQKKILHVKDPATGERSKFAWITDANYNDRERTISVTFHPKLKPYLLNLQSIYTTYALHHVARLRSPHAIRIYELLKQRQKIGHRTITVDELRSILMVEDIYPRYSNLKQKVILPAQDEIANVTDIAFSFVENKRAGKVESLTFTIHANAPRVAEDSAVAALAVGAEPRIRAHLISRFGFAPAEARSIQERYPADYLDTVLAIVEQRVAEAATTAKPVGNITAYARKAIEEDWRPQPGSLAAERDATTARREAADAARRQRDDAERARQQAERDAKDRAWTAYQALDATAQADLREAFGRDLDTGTFPAPAFVAGLWRSQGLGNPSGILHFRMWLAKRGGADGEGMAGTTPMPPQDAA